MPAAKYKSKAPIRVDPIRAVRTLCCRHLSEFVQEFWNEVVAEALVWSPHMEIICEEVQAVYQRQFMRYDKKGNMLGRLPKLYDLIINVPPGTSKSTIVSILAPVWAWINDPTMRIATFSYSDPAVEPMGEKSRMLIKSEKFRTYFPEVLIRRGQDETGNYETTMLGHRYCCGIGGSVMSKHFHILSVDDPLDPKQAASASRLKTAWDFYKYTLPTRKVDKEGTPTITIMQRLATDDPTGMQVKLMKSEGLPIRHICLPGELSPAVKPEAYRAIYQDGLLDPIRLSHKALKELRIKLGAAGYAGQIGQLPAPAAGLIWQKWFIEVPDEHFPQAKYFQNYSYDWDTAYTKDDTNAASAYVLSGMLGEKMYIDDIDWDWLETPELVDWMAGKQPRKHYVEAKANGKSIVPMLRKRKIVAIEVEVPGGTDKRARANMATPYAQAKFCYIRKSLADKLYNDENQGILLFPNGSYKDVADVLAQAILRQMQWSETQTAAGNEGSSLPGAYDETNYDIDAA